jgi:RecA-family ATPase
MPEPEWIVDGIIPTQQLMVLAGEAGVGKSFFCYSLALAVAGGLSFGGRSTRPGRVLYFDEENSPPDLRAYVHRLWTGHGKPDTATIEEHLRVESFSMTGALREDAASMFQIASEHQPSLVFVDTCAAVLQTEDENSNSEAAKHVRVMRRIKTFCPPECSIVVLKHATLNHKTGRKDIRGAKAWKGSTDATLYLGRPRGRPKIGNLNPTVLEPLKVRAFGLRFPLKITPVENTPGGISLDLTVYNGKD